MSEFPTDPRSHRKDKRVYCEAKTRRQMDTPYWGESKIGCSRLATQIVKGHPVCNLHADENKRYGWN